MYDTINCASCRRPLAKEHAEYPNVSDKIKYSNEKFLATCCLTELMCRLETTETKYGLPAV